MGTFDEYEELSPQAAALLRPGERLLAMASATLAFGAAPQPPGPRGGALDRIEGALDMPDTWIRRLFGGRVLDAGHGTVARAVCGLFEGYLAVSDQRLLWLRNTAGLLRATQLGIAYEVPREAVSSVRRKPRALIARNRIEVRFTDGSWIVLSSWPSEITSAGMRAVVRAFQDFTAR
ncbi:hypothetical protein EV193_110200 [Herbihabitans rhizosphaerae]|uniref:PH (Pleckstrin Homology) domain-containing protein n=1 Tax=Herbihabitans rhizosphaerae TaxID=1872711 RepID=A0A4Q7KGR5_9PSEU|nr:hypothetical protein [Herbihabitans rhizosphaerae]RZS34050.1 hypothetical protein EV193_110200 [Herbihabitans rhizosphaerae]